MFTCQGGTGGMYHLRVNFCIHLFCTLPPSLSHFSLIPISQIQYHPNTRCSEAAWQDSEVQLGCFMSPKPISKQNTPLTSDGSVFTVSCLHSTQGEVQLEMDSADCNPRETQGGRTYTGTPCSTPGPPQSLLCICDTSCIPCCHLKLNMPETCI